MDEKYYQKRSLLTTKDYRGLPKTSCRAVACAWGSKDGLNHGELSYGCGIRGYIDASTEAECTRLAEAKANGSERELCPVE